MKNSIRILNIVFLTAIYSFAIVFISNSSNYSGRQTNLIPSQEEFVTDTSVKLFYHTSQTNGFVTNVNNLPFPSLKNPFLGFLAIIEATEQIVETRFSQYTIRLKNILINQRKSDLIFPFHYFW